MRERRCSDTALSFGKGTSDAEKRHPCRRDARTPGERHCNLLSDRIFNRHKRANHFKAAVSHAVNGRGYAKPKTTMAPDVNRTWRTATHKERIFSHWLILAFGGVFCS